MIFNINQCMDFFVFYRVDSKLDNKHFIHVDICDLICKNPT